MQGAKPWVRHTISEGRCARCGIVPPPTADVDGKAYFLDGLGFLTHVPTGLVRIVDCEG